MSRRGENIRKRKKDGRWEGRYIKGYEDGKAKHSSVYGRSYLEVNKKLIEIRGSERKCAASKYENCSFRQAAYLWLENNRIKLKEPTYIKYRRLLDHHITPVIGGIPIQKVDASCINRLLFQKSIDGRLDGKGGLSPTYIRSIAFVLKSAMAYAVQNNYCAPLKGEIVLPARQKNKLEVLSIPEQISLEKVCFEEIGEKKLGILLSLYTGVRIGEVCGLRWDDIDLEKKTIHIHHTVERIQNIGENTAGEKTKLVLLDTKSACSDRIIPLPSKLLPLLAIKGTGFLIKGQVHDYADPRTIQYFFKNQLRKCNIRYVNYHTLRHTFATRCIESGMDIKSLSEILGHANVNITLGTYVHSTLEYKRTQLETMVAICSQK